jgi:imidazole glycerol-phosphate synthase subunit HisH
MNEIVIVNSPVANLKSVQNSLHHLGISHRVAYTPDDLHGAQKLLLPGVGAFGAGMEGLRTAGMITPIRAMAADGIPIMGICLGMQLLFEISEERGEYEGLGLLPGRIVRFPADGPKVPQIGWNQLDVCAPSPLLNGIKSGGYAYFVHSYYAATDPALILATCDYGIDFPAIVGRGRVFGAQFHPEKSQGVGLRLLKNFAELQ